MPFGGACAAFGNPVGSPNPYDVAAATRSGAAVKKA
jgi:hypothetical protein